MAKFYLNRNEKETTIIGVVFANNKRYRYATGIRVVSKFWNNRNYRLRVTSSYPEAIGINDKLDAWNSLLDDVFASLSVGAIQPTQDEFKLAVARKIKQISEDNNESKMLTTYAENWIDTTSRAKRTLIRHTTVLNILKKWEKSNKKICFDDVNMQLYNTLKKYFEAQSYSVNTIGENFKCIKVWMDDALDAGLHNNHGYKNKDFRVISEESDSIYLSMEELERLNNLKINDEIIIQYYPKIIKNKKNIERRILSLTDVRDRFLIGAFTALRFQDFSTLVNINLDTNVISVRNIKTGTRTTIPIHYIIKDVINRRNGILPPFITNQKMNAALKKLGNIAGIDEIVEISITKGGKRQTDRMPKYKLITTHTARRSACTNMYLSGIPTRVIMSFSGHKTEKSFLKYIKVNQFEDAIRMKDHPYFTG